MEPVKYGPNIENPFKPGDRKCRFFVVLLSVVGVEPKSESESCILVEPQNWRCNGDSDSDLWFWGASHMLSVSWLFSTPMWLNRAGSGSSIITHQSLSPFTSGCNNEWGHFFPPSLEPISTVFSFSEAMIFLMHDAGAFCSQCIMESFSCPDWTVGNLHAWWTSLCKRWLSVPCEWPFLI